MSDAIGLINALSNMSGALLNSYISSFSIISGDNFGTDSTKNFSCGNFSYAILYIQACGILYNTQAAGSYGSNSYIFITPNMTELSIYAQTLASSDSGSTYYGVNVGTVSSKSNSISITVPYGKYFISGSIICFN